MKINGKLFFSFFSVFCLAFLHILAIKFFLYWDIWWFDIFVHFVGGIAVASVFLYFIDFVSVKKYWRVWALVPGVLVVALLWEFFELSSGATFVYGNYYFDTITDLLAGLSGALVFSFVRK